MMVISTSALTRLRLRFTNANSLVFHINKGNKVRINSVNFFGNETVSNLKLKKQMKGTKEMARFTLKPSDTPSPYGTVKRTSFKEYLRNYGFLSITQTKNLIDPYFRFKFSGAKFDQKKYDEDLNNVLAYFNSLGYRDAQIIDTIRYYNEEGNLHVDIKVSEGRKYYFGDITWKGNTKYSD